MINYNVLNEYIEALKAEGVTPAKLAKLINAIEVTNETNMIIGTNLNVDGQITQNGGSPIALYKHNISIRNDTTLGFVTFDILNSNSSGYTTMNEIKEAMGTNKYVASGFDGTLGDVYTNIHQVFINSDNYFYIIGNQIDPRFYNVQGDTISIFNDNDTASYDSETPNFIDSNHYDQLIINDDVTRVL